MPYRLYVREMHACRVCIFTFPDVSRQRATKAVSRDYLRPRQCLLRGRLIRMTASAAQSQSLYAAKNLIPVQFLSIHHSAFFEQRKIRLLNLKNECMLE